MTANGQSQVWPIYSLCSYENSGSLLDLYRETFGASSEFEQATSKRKKEASAKSNTTNTNNNRHLTTSDYLTAEETQQQQQQQQLDESKLNDRKNDDDEKATGNNNSKRADAKNGGCKLVPDAGYLRWWQLIESNSSSKDQKSLEMYRVQVLNLCAGLSAALR